MQYGLVEAVGGKFTELKNAINAVDVENVMILIHNDFH
jgi:hypothetical protein